MKNKLVLIALSIFFVAFTTSCDKDEKESDTPLEINGQTFSWNEYGELWAYNEDTPMHNMNCFTGSLRLNPSDYSEMQGSGDWLDINFYHDGTALSAGTYTVSDNEEADNCSLTLMYDVSTSDGYTSYDESSYFVSGTINISGSDKTYTVTIDAVSEDGDALKGSFTATFQTMNVN